VPVPDWGAHAGLNSGTAHLTGMRHTGRMPRIYRADHTAHIRDRLKRQALHFSTGAVLAVLAAGAVAVLLWLLGDGSHHTLAVAVWGLVIALAVVSGIGLMLTGVEYLLYRRRRAELDAAGAEVIGEWHARLHRPKDDR
jgi:hypothetical protein